MTRRAGTFSQAKLSSPGPSLFGLAPCGVCPARCITATAVRSYRTFSPLPRRRRRYVLCGTSRQPGLNPVSRTLSGTLLCGVRTFLPRRRSAESDRPVQLPTTPLYAICSRKPFSKTFMRIFIRRGSNLNAGLAQPDWLIVAAIERWRNCRLFHLDKFSGETRIASARTAREIRRRK